MDCDRNHTMDLEAGKDCLRRCADTNFWDWTGGSRLFFWCWPAELREWARDGHPIYLDMDALPRYTRAQPREHNVAVKAKVKEKLDRFIK